MNAHDYSKTADRLMTCWKIPEHFDLLKSPGRDKGLLQPVINDVMNAAGQYLKSDELYISFPAGNHQGILSTHHLLPLAEACILTDDERYAHQCLILSRAYREDDRFYKVRSCTNLSIACWFEGLFPAVSWMLQSASAKVRVAAEEVLPALLKRVEEYGVWLTNFINQAYEKPINGSIQNHVTVAACALGQSRGNPCRHAATGAGGLPADTIHTGC